MSRYHNYTQQQNNQEYDTGYHTPSHNYTQQQNNQEYDTGYHTPSHNYAQQQQYTGEPIYMNPGPVDPSATFTGIHVSSPEQRFINHQLPNSRSIDNSMLASSDGARRHNSKYMNHLRISGYDQPTDPSMYASGSSNYFLDDSMAQLLADPPGSISTPSTSDGAGSGGDLGSPSMGVDIITRYVVISSEDRDWVNRTDESPYNFKVSVGVGSKKSNGDLVNIGIDDTLKNVISITCDKLTAPNRATITGYRHTNQPFLLLDMNGINDVTYGSNKGLKSSMAQMVAKIPIPVTFQDVTYLEFANINQQTKVYRTPKSEIYNMIIAINKADGQSVNSQTVTGLDTDTAGYGDVQSIQRILYDGVDSNSSVQYLDIITSTYFTGEFFKVGDVIKIRNWVFREAGLGYSEIAKFTAFINRDEGHIIQSVSKSTTGTALNNVIRILSPGSYSQISGEWEKENYFSSLITRTNINSSDSDDNAGKLINSNLQTHVLFRVNVLSRDSIRTQHMIQPEA